MSTLFVFTLLAIAILAVLFIWYKSKQYRYFPDDKILELDGTEDKILTNWYNSIITDTVVNYSELEVAKEFIDRNYNFMVNENDLVIGENLIDSFNKLKEHRMLSDKDLIFDIRSKIGKLGQIASISDPEIRQILRKLHSYDILNIKLIMDNNLDTIAREYLLDLLNKRWGKILALNLDNVLNTEGTFLYLKSSNTNIGDEEIINGIKTLITQQGARINLLCTDLEFNTLLNRLQKTTNYLVY